MNQPKVVISILLDKEKLGSLFELAEKELNNHFFQHGYQEHFLGYCAPYNVNKVGMCLHLFDFVKAHEWAKTAIIGASMLEIGEESSLMPLVKKAAK